MSASTNQDFLSLSVRATPSVVRLLPDLFRAAAYFDTYSPCVFSPRRPSRRAGHPEEEALFRALKTWVGSGSVDTPAGRDVLSEVL